MSRLRHASEDQDEGYFGSVSDLMVGILFVFLLMLTVFAINYRQEEENQRVARSLYEQQKIRADQQERLAEEQKQIAEHERIEADKQRHEAEAEREHNEILRGQLNEALNLLENELQQRERARQLLLGYLAQQLQASGVQVEIDERSGVLHLSGDLLFTSGSAALSPEARRTVRLLASVMAQTLPCYAQPSNPGDCPAGSLPVLEAVLIEGHTDHRAINGGQYRDNDQLSTERALTVFAELRRDQPSLDTIRNAAGLQLLGAAGYGDRRPRLDAQGSSEGDYRKNRRIDVRFVLTSRSSEELLRLRERIRRTLGEQ